MEARALQGLATSPTLYNLYLSDIPQPIENIGLGQFADDALMWAIAPRIDMAATKHNKFLEEYTNWTSDWRITINTTKNANHNNKDKKKTETQKTTKSTSSSHQR